MEETEKLRVLIVDDEPGVRESLRMVLKDRCRTTVAASGEEALVAAERDRFDVVLLDILMPGIDGLQTLEQLRVRAPFAQVVMLTATKTIRTAVQAMKLGAFDYLTKPFDLDELCLVVERAAESGALRQEVKALRSEVGQRYGFDNIIAGSPKMQQVVTTVARVAPLRSTVLITGESGTGKEVVAKAIHYNSPRAERPLIIINCAAIPDNLLESELFGHERGAFTDAHVRKLGQFEQAHRGTIFLDEIGEMNPATQAKILRVLEQGTFTRVGGAEPIEVDVRVIAATNRDLQLAMRDGAFRPDLFFRLNVVAIHLPPLRERGEDLPAFIRHFLQHKAAELGVAEKRFTREAFERLLSYRWPGNVRELENVIERALALAQGPQLGIEDLSALLTEPVRVVPPGIGFASPPPSAEPVRTLSAAVDELEHDLILQALARADYNQTRAAEILGTTRRILKYKMDKFGIRDDEAGAS